MNYAIALMGLIWSAAAFCQTSSAYTQTNAIGLGWPDRWDYIFYDGIDQRAYVAHASGVSVVDTGNGTLIGIVEGTPGGSHGITVVHSAGLGYTDDGEAGQIKVFDLQSLKIIKTIKGEVDADGIILEPATQHVFVVNGDSGSLSVVNPTSNSLAATIRIGSKLEAAVPDGAGLVYVNGAEKRELFRVDARSNKVTASWPIADCESPHGIAIDTRRHRVFVSCVNERLVVVDTTNGHELATIPIGKGTDAAGFDPARNRIFSSNGRDGTLSVIEEEEGDAFKVIATVPTAVSARTMDLDPVSGTIFLPAATVDTASPGLNGRPRIVAGSLRLLIFSPSP